MSQCGIGSIINKTNGKLFIFKSRDLTKTWENYHALLTANYHHNKELQKDWNDLGHLSFVFEIKEITEDNEELMNQKLDEYVKEASELYNDVNLDNVPFIYKTKILMDELYNIIGETNINPIFLNKLSINNIDEKYYKQIKSDAENAINNGEVKIGEVDKLLDDLISEIIKNKEIELETKRENQLNELYKLTGKTKLIKKYLELLDSKGLSPEIGLEIKHELVDLINNDKLDVSVKDKFNELIDEKKSIEDEKIQSELLTQLHDLTGKLDLTEEYVKKLQEKELSPEIGFIIRQNIKKQIQEGKIRDESLEDVLNNAIEEECEKLAIEKENKLIDYLYGIVGKDELNSQFMSKLDVFNINHEKGFKIKKDIFDLIKNHEITEEFEIDSKIDELIEIEVIEETNRKNQLFDQLHAIMGEKQLSDEFKSRLESYNLDEEWGLTLLNSLENDITTCKIDESFDFNSYIDESIISKKETELLTQLDEIFDDEIIHDKINKNLLNSQDSNQIKHELKEIIKSKDIDAMINLENSNLEHEVDNRILERHNLIKEDVLDMRENLLGDLYTVVNEEYMPKVKAGKIREEHVDKTKKHIEDVIKQNEIIDSKFKYKINELRDLEKNTVKTTFKSLMDEEKRLEKVELDKLRKELKSDASLLFKNISTSFINLKLKEYGLSSKYAKRTENKINKIIDSDNVYNDRFTFKMEELTYYKQNSFKDEIIKILDQFKAENDKKLEQLYEVTGKDTLSPAFKNALTNKGLNEQAGLKIVSEFEENILNEKVTTNIQAKVYNRLNQMEIDKNEAYELLEKKVGSDANKFFFSARLTKRKLDSEIHGMAIKRNIETLIQSGEVNSKNFDSILDKELDNAVKQKNEKLRKEVDIIIGLDKINEPFLTQISKYNLTETDAIKIRSNVLNLINENKFEEKSIKPNIDGLVYNFGDARTKELTIDKLNSIIGKNSINQEFSKRLDAHDLDNADGQKIKSKIIKQINKGEIGLDDLEQFIGINIQTLETNDVKNELDKLSGNQIDTILKKHSISSLIPLKGAKISKLMDNVSLIDLKKDLAECGVSKYKIKYGSGFSSFTSNNDNNNFCANCGAKLDNGAKFCSSCGNKVE